MGNDNGGRPLALLILILLCSPFLFSAAISLTEPRQSPSTGAGSALPDPHRCFLDEFASSSKLLSSTGIVEMVPRRGVAADPSSAAHDGDRPLRQEFFSCPLIPLLYERVLPPLWAAGLRVGGQDEEYRNAASYLLKNIETGRDEGEDSAGVLLDLSCGTGFVGVRMARSGGFRHVFALDYSEPMLGEVVAAARREGPGDLPLSVIRGDAGRLPFGDGALDAVHWGAAMHCVPDAGRAMGEVYRVLKPGGKLYATTFLRPFPDIVFRFFELGELEDIAKGAGFGVDGGELEVGALKRLYGVIRATKGE